MTTTTGPDALSSVVPVFARLDLVADFYGVSTRKIWRLCERHEIATMASGGRTHVWMPSVDKAMHLPPNRGGRPKGSARPRLNTPTSGA